MHHTHRLVRRGHNISGTGAELAELLGIDSLSHTSDEEEQGDATLQQALKGAAEQGSKASNTTQAGKSKRTVKEVYSCIHALVA
jgi:hypothetical protein